MDSGLRSRITALLATGVTNPPAPRPAWLRRGRFDLVFIADVVIALIAFGATDGMLGTEAARHHSSIGTQELLLVSFVMCAPLVLRTRFPLTAWTASAVAILWANLAVPYGSLSSAVYIPAGVIVYVLCLYAVAVRCELWVVTSAGI